MDGTAAAEIRKDDAEIYSRSDDGTFENGDHPPMEDSGDGVGDCGAAFSKEVAYMEHRHQHHQQNVNLDSQSDDLPNTEKDNEKTHFCTICSLSFVEISELHLHMKNHHPISRMSEFVNNSGLTKQQTYECSDCGKSYSMIGHYLNHLRSHRKPSKSLLDNLEHLKKKSFQCESCGRSYSRASALDAHRRCHEEKLVKSKNKSSEDLVQTVESDVETKPSESVKEDDSDKYYKCICGKAFSTASRLKTHQRFSRNSQCAPEKNKPKTRKNGNEFYCSECNKGFNSHIAFFSHQRRHSNPSNNSAERFPCEECGKVFMTLTFYYRHQRMAHSNETPAKSFLHQVCQVQKKAFECKDCGLKFSRASALHSHQLQHTDAFRETEKSGQVESPSVNQDKKSGGGCEETKHSEASLEEKVQPESLPATCVVKELHINEADEDMESYEPGDFNVQVISASESEDEAAQDPNPDLELLCESDHDVRDDTDDEVYPGNLVSKPGMDLKIVQIDFNQSNEQCSLVESEDGSKAAEERFDCPDCYRWFTNPVSLRVHRMWHGVRKRRQQAQGQSVAVYTCETSSNEAQLNHNDPSSSTDLLNQAEGLEKKTFTCNECGDVFSDLSALVSHQSHHPKRKQFKCPDCLMSYLHAASLINHMKTCSAQKRENITVCKKEYNPKKTLLGPKIYHCELCGKGFWSLGAYSHHKQNQMECTDLRLRKGLSGSLHSATGRSRSAIKVACPVCGRKFRHKGIMALHMRKHENGNHKCEICNRSFRLFSSLLRHQVVHSDQLLPPPIKSFQHQVEQLKKNTYSCPDCGKLFSRAKALQFHMKSHGYESENSPQSTANTKDLQCPTCLAHFNNKVSLRAHQKLCIKKDGEIGEPSNQIKEQADVKKEDEHADKSYIQYPDSSHLKYKCKICNRGFSVAGALNFHKKSHAEENKSVTKSTTGLSLVKMPNKEEPGKGLIHCSDCGRGFMTKSALGSHRRWHKDKKCSQIQVKEEDLKSIDYKTEDGPFQCEKCGKQFFNHRVLQRHRIFNPQCQTKIESDSNRNVERNGTPEQFSCLECYKTFDEVSHLASHLENEHSKTWRASERQEEPYHIPEPGSKSLSALKPKAHECPLCSMTFAKPRGLRAHKWQAHSKSKKRKSRLLLNVKTEPSDTELKTEDSVTVKDSGVGRGKKKTRSDPQPVKFISCLNCGKQCSSAASLLDHRRVCLEVNQESKLKIQTPEATAEVPPPLGRLLEHTAKCLFKCDKCGKAFQTEKQLESHRNKARSRPHCCALCCHGFWTENQLQQHLSWHDEVRCRLPNEVRFRLSAAMTSKTFKPNYPDSSFTMNQHSLNPTSQSQTNESSITCKDCGLKFTHTDAYKTHLHQHALEEEESQLGDNRTHAADVDTEKNQDETMSGVTNGDDTSSSVQMQPTESTALVQNTSRSAYTCLVCGKAYSYLVSYEKHLKLHDESPSKVKKLPEKQPPDSSLRMYECPDCGMSFIRRTRLISHLRVHKSRSRLELTPAKCDQCNKCFTTAKSWMAHVELHNLRRFWCLSCAEGFFDEIALDKHLQSHGLKQNNQTTEAKISPMEKESPHHPKSKIKLDQCKYCEKVFRRGKSYNIHQMWHIRQRAVGRRLEDLAPVAPVTNIQDSKNEQLTGGTEEVDLSLNKEELPEDGTQSGGGESSFDEAECGDPENSEESDCGEPLHCISVSKSPSRADLSSESVKSPAGLEQGKKVHREHKYWEWECTECDMGFDEITKLHLHYIKHATGEVPLPQEDIEG